MFLTKVGKALEWAFYVSFAAYMIKVICVVLVGYLYMRPEWAGPVFFYWRKQFCDSEAAKHSYSFINPNGEDLTKTFVLFTDTVQPVCDLKWYKGIEKDLNERIGNPSKGIFGFFADDTVKLKEKLKEHKTRYEKKASINAKGLTPLYSVGSYTDTFVLGPRKTFKVFRGADEEDTQLMELELDFLAFRHVFLRYLSTSTAEENVPSKSYRPYREVYGIFKNFSSCVKERPGTDQSNITLEVNGTEISMERTRYEAVKKYFGIYDSFNEIIVMLENVGSKPVSFNEDGTVVIDSNLVNQIGKIVRDLGLENLLKDSEGTLDLETSLKGFFSRLAMAKASSLDTHALNRFYYYYLFTRSYLNPGRAPRKDAVYEELKATIRDIGNSSNKDLITKRGIYIEKLNKRRVELIFNHLSHLIANKLGNKGIVLKSKEDTRKFLLSYFAYPAVYGEKDYESVRTIFIDYSQ